LRPERDRRIVISWTPATSAGRVDVGWPRLDDRRGVWTPPVLRRALASLAGTGVDLSRSTGRSRARVIVRAGASLAALTSSMAGA